MQSAKRRCFVKRPLFHFSFFVWLLGIGIPSGLLGATSVTAVAENSPEHHTQSETPAAGHQHKESPGTQPALVHHRPDEPAAADEKKGETPPAEPALSLEQLEQMALESNPTLAQATAQVQAAAGRTLQAGLYPNPSVGYSGAEISGPASGGEHGGFVQQTIVTGGKLGLSRAVFQQEQAQAEEQAQAQRLRVLNTVRLLYYQTLGAQQLVSWRERLAMLAQEAVEISQQLFNVGQADQPDLLQAEVEAQRAQLDLGAAQHDLERSWRQLAAVVGNPDLQQQALAGKLDEALPELDWDKSLATLLEESPERKVAQVGVQRAEAALKRAQVEWIPDVTLRGGIHYNFERFAPGNAVIGPEGFAEIRIPLPVFDRNQGNVAAAQADLERARHEVQRVALSLRQRLSATFAEYLTARRTVETYSTRILPTTRQAYELYLQRYQQMAAAYPQVLIAQRTLFQAQVAYAAALTNLWRTVVEIRGLLLVDGLAAPAAQGETTGTPGVRVTAAEMASLRRAGRQGDE
jgi:cobalt-zinc-cadmium efflux system outer membrane protein